MAGIGAVNIEPGVAASPVIESPYEGDPWGGYIGEYGIGYGGCGEVGNQEQLGALGKGQKGKGKGVKDERFTSYLDRALNTLGEKHSGNPDV